MVRRLERLIDFALTTVTASMLLIVVIASKFIWIMGGGT